MSGSSSTSSRPAPRRGRRSNPPMGRRWFFRFATTSNNALCRCDGTVALSESRRDERAARRQTPLPSASATSKRACSAAASVPRQAAPTSAQQAAQAPRQLTMHASRAMRCRKPWRRVRWSSLGKLGVVIDEGATDVDRLNIRRVHRDRNGDGQAETMKMKVAAQCSPWKEAAEQVKPAQGTVETSVDDAVEDSLIESCGTSGQREAILPRRLVEAAIDLQDSL